MDHRLTRFQAALLGCALAAIGCCSSLAVSSQPTDQRVIELPAQIGSWQLLEEDPLAESELTMLRAHDHWRRLYRCQKTGRQIVATLFAGASGPLVCHQPESCYSRTEFSSSTSTQRWRVPDSADQFWFQSFQPRDVDKPAMTIGYAWHDGDHWRAPNMPRLQLAGRSTLQRLQISMPHPAGSAAEARQAIQQFLQSAVNPTEDARSRLASHSQPPDVLSRSQ